MVVRSAFWLKLFAGAFALIILSTTVSRHIPVVRASAQNKRGSVPQASAEPDQVNTEGWDQAWTNLLNDVEQSFTPSQPRLMAVEVELVLANPGADEDELALNVLDASGHTLATVAQNVQAANVDRVVFQFTSGGVELSPGQLYRLRLSGGPTFGWKYVVGGYPRGEATFNGKPLLKQARSTFLFRTFGQSDRP